MSDLFRIVDWDGNFENSRSRIISTLNWVPIPNGFDGDKMTELIIEGGDGAYAAWVALVLVASKCQPRGTLVRATGKPHTADTLSRMTRLSREAFESMLEVALAVGLIERCHLPDGQPSPGRHPIGAERTNEPKEQKERTERTEPKAPARRAKVRKSVSSCLSIDGSAVGCPDTRRGAMMRFANLITPFMATEGRQKEVDQGAMNRWFDTVWPEDAARSEATHRWELFMEIAKDAKAKAKKPMAYIQKRIAEIK